MARAALLREKKPAANQKPRRIICGTPNAAAHLSHLFRKEDGDVVSPKQRKITQAVFGQPLSPVQVVGRICADVRQRGLPAVIQYTDQLDRVKLTPDTIRVSGDELAHAHAQADPEMLDTVRRVRMNIISFQSGLLHSDAVMTVSGSHELQVRYRPLRRVGICIPGGAAAYPSTLLMTICPAQTAGVKELAVVMPPTPNGAGNRELLAICHELGVTEVYRVGGAQAVAALAYGVAGLPPVDMIVGPGNLFVALAKRYVYGQVAIDCIAGPSEVVVLADATGRADFIAADMLAQAEHAPGSSVLVTWHEPLLDAVHGELQRQLADLSRAELTRESLEQFGAMVLARDANEAVKTVNALGPEHLEIMAED